MEKFRVTEENQENSVDAFTLLPGEEIPLHFHEGREEEYECQEGKGTLIIQGIKREFTKGDKFIINKGSAHSMKNVGKTPLKFLAINIPRQEKDDTTFL